MRPRQRLRQHMDTPTRDADSFKGGAFIPLILTEVHRQRDPEFLEYLGNILRGENLKEAVEYFNTAKISESATLQKATTITPRSADATKINMERLAKLDAPGREYIGEVISGNYDPENAPPDHRLVLKIGALVIFTGNFRKFINGTKGIITNLDDTIITVRLLEDGREVGVARDIWIRFEYDVDPLTRVVEEAEVGRYTQFPLRLGYAMTIHKAQGITLDSVIIDKGQGYFFAHGQLYAA